MPAEPASTAQPLSLYLHAPYCRSRCGYCAFASRALPAAPDWNAYAETLAAEAALWGARLNRPRIETVFYGGGTPSLVPPEALARIFAALRQAFHIAPDAEITCEANPESATPGFLAAARSLGLNRLSLGAQSLDDGMLRLLGRAHDAAQVRRAVAEARALSGEGGGFENLGLDLIWGLPGQTPEHWLKTLRLALDLAPDHLSCYALTLEPGTPLALDLAAGLSTRSALPPLPDEDDLERMYLLGGELLEAAGFEHYEVSNFARPGRACRHNSLAWAGAPYLGLGPAAVSTLALPGHLDHGPPGPGQPAALRFANPDEPEAWAARVKQADRLGSIAPPPDAEALSPGTLRRERLMLALRTSRGAPLADLPARADRHDLMGRLVAQGLARTTATHLALTRKGLLVSNAIIAELAFG